VSSLLSKLTKYANDSLLKMLTIPTTLRNIYFNFKENLFFDQTGNLFFDPLDLFFDKFGKFIF